MAERQASAIGVREKSAAIVSLLTGALVWGVIWYPYRVLRDMGIDGVVASAITYAVAFVLGLFFFRRSFAGIKPGWVLFWIALASGGCNIGYVLATLDGEVVRVLLLFYLAPLWTVLLSRLLLGERLNRYGIFVVILSLGGAMTMLWELSVGLPVPQDAADWSGLIAGFSFASLNVLSRKAHGVSIELKAMVSFAGAAVVALALLLAGIGIPQAPSSSSAWPLLFGVGAVLLLVNFVVQYGLVRIASNRAIVILLSEVGFAALSSWLLADETIGLREWLGGAMIVAASVFSAKMES
ncbi:DMT family transporter [Propionivibrio soli]|uniref:DMT family transporter n=1 Tax=Propionivibrio soli TaxID=2976531 RepID=UPI0021E7B407|nr:DMT family transporter [Propionivibrio soli]